MKINKKLLKELKTISKELFEVVITFIACSVEIGKSIISFLKAVTLFFPHILSITRKEKLNEDKTIIEYKRM